MKATSAAIQQLQAEVAFLKTDLAEAKSLLVKQAEATAPERRSYAGAVGQTSKRNHGQSQSHCQLPRKSTARLDETAVKKPTAWVKVSGARKVWSTIKSCTVTSVKSAISRVCKNDTVKVKRKVKNNPGDSNGARSSRWWFILHDTEEALVTLEVNWEQLALQTSWKLMDCYMPEPHPPAAGNPIEGGKESLSAESFSRSHDNNTLSHSNSITDPEGAKESPNVESPSHSHDKSTLLHSNSVTESTGEHAAASQPTDSHLNRSSPFRSSQELLPTT